MAFTAPGDTYRYGCEEGAHRAQVGMTKMHIPTLLEGSIKTKKVTGPLPEAQAPRPFRLDPPPCSGFRPPDKFDGAGTNSSALSPARPSPAQLSAQPSPAQPGPAQPSPARPGPARPGPARPSPCNSPLTSAHVFWTSLYCPVPSATTSHTGLQYLMRIKKSHSTIVIESTGSIWI